MDICSLKWPASKAEFTSAVEDLAPWQDPAEFFYADFPHPSRVGQEVREKEKLLDAPLPPSEEKKQRQRSAPSPSAAQGPPPPKKQKKSPAPGAPPKKANKRTLF